MFHYRFFKGTSSDRPGPCKDLWRRGWVSNHEASKNSANTHPEQNNKCINGIG